MTTPFTARLGSLVAAALVLLAWFSPLGDLTPPAGVISSTMKPLSQVEPRTPLASPAVGGDADALFLIDKPGSYYLVGNIVGVAGKRAIEIASDDVTLDLSGFLLDGVTGSLQGIATQNTTVYRNLVIRNGSVERWGSDGIDVRVDGLVVEDVAARNCGGNGMTNIPVASGGATRVSRCSFEANASKGLSLVTRFSLVESCMARANQLQGISLTGSGSVVRDCVSMENAFGGYLIDHGLIVNCTANGNDKWGIAVLGGACRECVAGSGVSVGITADQGAVVANCTAHGNGTIGIAGGARCTIRDSTLESNDIGISVASSGCRVEGNSLASHTIGIRVLSGGNVITGNRATQSSTQSYQIAAGNTVGTELTGTAAMNAAANDMFNLTF